MGKHVKHIFCLLILLSAWNAVFAQGINPKDENLLERKIETIAENSDEEVDYTNLFDNLMFFLEHPVDLNYATVRDLQELLIIDDTRINSLQTYIKENGKLLSIYELQAVPGFDLTLINQLRPYIKVGRDLNRVNITFKEMFRNAKHELFFRVSQVIEEQKGFSDISPEELEANPNARFLGSPQRYFTRYRFRYGNYLSIGFTGEKDAGEEFFRGSQKQGFDFMSAHIAIRNYGRLKSLNIGDYQAQFGQGLTFWSGFSFGKTADAMNIKRSAQGLRAYTSVNESQFMRGIGATVNFGKIDVTVFGSRKFINTNVSEADSASQDIIAFSSFNLSGFHRTPNELAKKNNVRETIAGTHITYFKRNYNFGLTAVYSNYSADLQKSSTLYNNFEFNDRTNLNLGLDFNYILRNFNFFGEVSRSANGAVAYTGGMIASLDPKMSFSLLHRNFARDYQALYTAAIGESSRNFNENGTYLGMVIKPHKHVSISSYFDVFRFPWLRYLINAPSVGHDGLVQINYTPSRSFDMYFRFRDRSRGRNVPSAEELLIVFPESQQQQNFRFDVSYKISPSFRLRNRVEYVIFQRFGQNPERGFVVLQDIVYKPLSKPYSFSLRYALFDTESFNSRIYAFENDVLYSFSIPAYYYQGSRFYLTTKYVVSRKIDLWFRYAQTYYTNRNSSGTGLTEVIGPSRSDFRIQIRLKF